MEKRQKRDEFFRIYLLLAGLCVIGAGVLALCWAAKVRLPEGVGRVLPAEEQAAVIERNSPLTEYVFLSPNADFPREGTIKKITIHHMAGDLSLENLGTSFSNKDRRASSNYAIDSQGRVALYVEEQNRAWTSSSPENDHQAVTIEVANDELEGDWHVSDATFNTLIELCADVCRRNGIDRLVFTGDETGNLTTHKMFNPDTQCPGPYLEGRMEEIAGRVNERLAQDG